MKVTSFLSAILIIGLFSSCQQSNRNNTQNQQKYSATESPFPGKWVRMVQGGLITLNFMENGVVEGDFGNDQIIDLESEYEIDGDTIRFWDKAGQSCPEMGVYLMTKNDCYLGFDLIKDDCNGRIKTTMGFWTKPNYQELLGQLTKKIAESPNADFHLNRARLYMAIGNPRQARSDLDKVIESNASNAKIYINRAGTRFPDDMQGAVLDCNKALSLDPNQKNAYFLRGLARYELGEKDQACEDFQKAIDLGFTILRIAEHRKCSEYWGNGK